MKYFLMVVIIPVVGVWLAGCRCMTKAQSHHQVSLPGLQNFIDAHVTKVKPLAKKAALASWKAASSGEPNDYKKAGEMQFRIRKIYTDPEDFVFLKQLKQSGQISEPVLARQLDVLYNAYLGNQIDPELLKRIVDLSTDIEKNFSTFRGTIDGEKVTTNQIKDILRKESDLARRKKAWLASKQVGPVVASDLIHLIKLRNRAARQVGFENFHTLALTTGEQDVKELDRIFEKLYQLTNEPFAELKLQMDEILADKYSIEVQQLRPWHYHDPFFQEAPQIYEVDLDRFYEDENVKEVAARFYRSIGMPVEDVLRRSDLYEREGKNPHAFCTDIDKEGDVRILCNLKNDEKWMETILHELGHAIYDKYHDPDVPYLLREPAHIFTTEAIAMFFGRLSRNPAWMKQMLGFSQQQKQRLEEPCRKYNRLQQLIFARWAMVMYDFEKQLYANPEQDLNDLWWDIVDKYQLVTRPQGRDKPDWAAKIHFTIAPCYYHNYVLGELLASQLKHYMICDVLNLPFNADVGFVGRTEIGEYLKKNVFEPGDIYPWNEMIRRATGNELTPEYFVAEFVQASRVK